MKRLALLLLVVLAACTAPGWPAAPTAGPSPQTRAAGPTPAPADTPTPTTAALPSPATSPSDRVLVVYAREGALWAYDGETAHVLPTGGPAAEPLLSPDGRRVLYRRPEPPTELAAEPFSLWLHDMESGQETAVDLSALPDYPIDLEGRTVSLPRLPQQIAWLPDGRAALFNTQVDFSMIGPGSLLSDDLWQVDAATGAVRLLFPEEAPPASFTIGPDGAWLLVNRPTRIEARNLATGERRTLLEFPMVPTYSEYAWLPEPRWLPGGDAAYVAIAPADPMAGSTFGLWRLDVKKGTAEQFAQVEGTVYAWSPDGRSWSPDGARLAYISSAEGQPRVTLRAVGPGTAGLAASVTLGETMPRILGWTPDGQVVLVQEGTDLYGVQAGPGVQSRRLAAIDPWLAELFYGLGDAVLLSTGEGRLFRLAPDGSAAQEIP